MQCLFGYQLISETDRLQDFPELGRIVPEHRNEIIREIIFSPYRIVYKVHHRSKAVKLSAFGVRPEEYHSCKVVDGSALDQSILLRPIVISARSFL